MNFDFLRKAMKSRPSKFQGLLYAMLLSFLLQPFVPEGRFREALVTVVTSLVLIASIYAISDEKRKYVITSIVLVIPALVISVLYSLSGHSEFLIISYISKIIFLFYVAYVSLRHVLTAKSVSEDTIVGSICIYLLFGLTWAHIYALIEHLNPGSYKGLAIDYSHSEFATNILRDFIYHSFTTLTTVGYGDIVPVSMLARTFNILEAIVGQVYMTVLVARIIGLYIKQK